MQTVTHWYGLQETGIAVGEADRRSPDGIRRQLPALPRPRSPCPNYAGYRIRLAQTEYQQGEARMLVRQMYAWRGYATKQDGVSPDNPNRITLAAWQGEELAATLTIGRDSSSGLLADTLYADELDGLRRPDRVVCEVSRLAVNPEFRSGSLLAALFEAALRYGKELFAASDVVIEVNPRHATYYQRRYGFRQIGDRRHCPRVEAPAVLLHQVLDEIDILPDALAWG